MDRSAYRHQLVKFLEAVGREAPPRSGPKPRRRPSARAWLTATLGISARQWELFRRAKTGPLSKEAFDKALAALGEPQRSELAQLWGEDCLAWHGVGRVVRAAVAERTLTERDLETQRGLLREALDQYRYDWGILVTRAFSQAWLAAYVLDLRRPRTRTPKTKAPVSSVVKTKRYLPREGMWDVERSLFYLGAEFYREAGAIAEAVVMTRRHRFVSRGIRHEKCPHVAGRLGSLYAERGAQLGDPRLIRRGIWYLHTAEEECKAVEAEAAVAPGQIYAGRRLERWQAVHCQIWIDRSRAEAWVGNHRRALAYARRAVTTPVVVDGLAYYFSLLSHLGRLAILFGHPKVANDILKTLEKIEGHPKLASTPKPNPLRRTELLTLQALAAGSSNDANCALELLEKARGSAKEASLDRWCHYLDGLAGSEPCTWRQYALGAVSSAPLPPENYHHPLLKSAPRIHTLDVLLADESAREEGSYLE
jgi:hypothetical protein